MRRIGLAATAGLLLLAVVTATAAADEHSSDALVQRMWSIAERLDCPVCQGQSVRDSNSQLAAQMRGVILTKLENGESEDSIFAFFASRYGASVLREPPAEGLALGVWIGPLVALALGVLIVARVVSRPRARQSEPADALRPYETQVGELRRRAPPSQPKP